MTSEHATPTTAPGDDADGPATSAGDDRTATTTAPPPAAAAPAISPAATPTRPRPTAPAPVRPRSAERGVSAFPSVGPRRPSTGPLTLDPGLLIALVGAVLAFLAAFLTWASTDARSSAGSLVGGGTVTRTGLQGGHLGLATLILSLVAIALVVLLAMPATRPWGWIALASAGALALLLAVVDAIASSAGSDVEQKVRAICAPRGVACSASSSTGTGVWLTMLAGLLIGGGAVLHHRPSSRLTTALSRSGAQPEQRPAPSAGSTPPRTPVGTVTRHPMTQHPTTTAETAPSPSESPDPTAGAASPAEGTSEEPPPS